MPVNWLLSQIYHEQTNEKYFASKAWLYHIYEVKLPSGYVRIKEIKPSLLTFIYKLQIRRLLEWIRSRTFNSARGGPLKNNHGFTVMIGKESDEKSFGIKITHTLRKHFDRSERLNTADKLNIVSNFLRGIMFFKHCRIQFRHVNWDHVDLVDSISKIGEILPCNQFIVYITLPEGLNDNIIVQLQIKGKHY